MNFQTLLNLQLELQLEAYGKDPRELEGDELADFIRWNAYSLINELIEATNEVGWKPWATSRHVNTERFAEESVDMLHFFANLCLATKVTGEMLTKGYLAKREKNAQRQREGYDGVSSKCPKCKRDLEEALCRPDLNWCAEIWQRARRLHREEDTMASTPQKLPGEGFFGEEETPTYRVEGDFAGKAGRILQKVQETGEPFFVLRAKDIFSVMVIREYLRLIEQYAPENIEFQEGLWQVINDMRNWQREHVDQVRYPD